MRAILVRHYKTVLNACDRIMGWGDAPRVRDWLADVAFVDETLSRQQIRFEAIYSSSLERARQTAMYYARRRGIGILRDCPELNEVNYGLLYRMSKKWVAKRFPQHKKDPDFVYPGGESFRQMQHRSVRFLLSLSKAYPQQTVFLVVHAGVIRGLVSHFLGLEYAAHLKQKVSHRYIGQLDFEGDRCVRYDELGKLSGFVSEGIIQIPIHRSTPARAATHAESGGL